MPESLPDYYGILGVAPTASVEEIHSAFRHRAQECHPDKHPGDPAAVERFKEVNEAYHLLSNERARREYDARLTTQEAGHPDVEIEVTLGLTELYRGCRLRLMVPRASVCPSCAGSGSVVTRASGRCTSCGGSGWGDEEIYLGVHSRQRCGRCQGRGRVEESGVRQPCMPCQGLGGFLVSTPTDVRLPPGLLNGQRLRVPGQGQPLLQGGEGDLYLRVTILPGAWVRRGEDLVVDLPLPARTLSRGGTVPVQTPLEHSTIAVPRGSRYGTMFRLRGLGPPYPEGGGRGDLFVRLVPAPTGR